MTDWPPEGYSDPRQWEKDPRGIAIIGIILGVVFTYSDGQKFFGSRA